jgi:hypothetical protein
MMPWLATACYASLVAHPHRLWRPGSVERRTERTASAWVSSDMQTEGPLLWRFRPHARGVGLVE